MQRSYCASLALLAAILQPTLAYGRTYIVKQGDTLSSIAKRELGGPVWGKNGTLRKILDLNKLLSNPNLIFPNQEIILSLEEPEQAPVESAAMENPPVESVPASEETVMEHAQPADEAEQPTTDSTIREESQAHYGFSLHGVLSTTDIDVRADDNSYETSLHSKINQGFRARAYYLFSENSSLGLHLGLLQTDFSNTRDGRFIGKKKNLRQFGAFYNLKFAERWHFELSLGTEEVIFISQRDVALFKLDPVFVDYARGALAFDLYAGEALQWSLGIEAKHNRATEGRFMNVEGGFSYGVNSSVAYEVIQRSFFEGGMFYDRRVQNTNQARHRNTDTGVTIGARFEY
jgi:LysM repeat protein